MRKFYYKTFLRIFFIFIKILLRCFISGEMNRYRYNLGLFLIWFTCYNALTDKHRDFVATLIGSRFTFEQNPKKK